MAGKADEVRMRATDFPSTPSGWTAATMTQMVRAAPQIPSLKGWKGPVGGEG